MDNGLMPTTEGHEKRDKHVENENVTKDWKIIFTLKNNEVIHKKIMTIMEVTTDWNANDILLMFF